MYRDAEEDRGKESTPKGYVVRIDVLGRRVNSSATVIDLRWRAITVKRTESCYVFAGSAASLVLLSCGRNQGVQVKEDL